MMKPVKRWQTPKIIGTMRKFKPFYIGRNSLVIDKESKSVWINLKSSNFRFKKKKTLPYVIRRIDEGTNNDFEFWIYNFTNNLKCEVLELISDYSFWSFFNQEGNGDVKSIEDKIEMLKNLFMNYQQSLQTGQSTNLPKHILKNLKFTQEDLKVLDDVEEFIDNLPKVEIGELISSENYSLLFGELSVEETISNVVATEMDNIKKPTLTEDKVAKNFEKIVLADDVKRSIYAGVGMADILIGKRPKTGGVILIDHGGTGKSMMKAALKKLFRDMAGDENSVKEKSQGDISSYVNAGPQVIKKWYRGGPKSQVTGGAEVDLVAQAKKVGVPSLMVIDEAEEFIRDRKNSKGYDPVNALNILKKYIQDVSKGGVTGYVVTVLIANMDPDEIHNPLKQGAERLNVVYLGFPKTRELWLEIFEIAFKKINFLGVNFSPEILADLVLYHNKIVSHDEFGISPRRMIAYVDDFLAIHSGDIKDNSKGDLNFFRNLMKGKSNNSNDKINFKDFVNCFIKDVLSEKLLADNSISNKDEVKANYGSYLRYFDGEEKISIDERIENQKKANFTRQGEILEGKLRDEYDELKEKLDKLVELCKINYLSFMSEGKFINPIKDLIELLNKFESDYRKDPKLNQSLLGTLENNLNALKGVCQRIVENKVNSDTDLILFIHSIESLPDSKDLFGVKKSESGIVTEVTEDIMAEELERQKFRDEILKR